MERKFSASRMHESDPNIQGGFVLRDAFLAEEMQDLDEVNDSEIHAALSQAEVLSMEEIAQMLYERRGRVLVPFYESGMVDLSLGLRVFTTCNVLTGAIIAAYAGCAEGERYYYANGNFYTDTELGMKENISNYQAQPLLLKTDTTSIIARAYSEQKQHYGHGTAPVDTIPGYLPCRTTKQWAAGGHDTPPVTVVHVLQLGESRSHDDVIRAMITQYHGLGPDHLLDFSVYIEDKWYRVVHSRDDYGFFNGDYQLWQVRQQVR